nr:MAG TPA: hypothetical protein [Caudoviricetes sp.]
MLYQPLAWWRGYFTTMTTTVIPNIYWSAYDAEQRILEICNALQRIETTQLDGVTTEQLNQALALVDKAIQSALTDANDYTDAKIKSAVATLEKEIADVVAGTVLVRDVTAGQKLVNAETGIWDAYGYATPFAVNAGDLDALGITAKDLDQFFETPKNNARAIDVAGAVVFANGGYHV